MPPIELEVCIETRTEAGVREAVRAAAEGGATRVELCSQMERSGLTPALAHVRAARAADTRPALLAMARPRDDDFRATPDDARAMVHLVERLGGAGADGVVLGLLTPGGEVDLEAVAPLVARAHALGLLVTFHRAVDAARDPVAAIDDLARIGVDRVLSAGIPWGAPGTALDGAPRLARMIERAENRLEVVVGGGIHAGNVAALIARLPAGGRYSLHAYSGAREDGHTTADSVRRLHEAIRRASHP